MMERGRRAARSCGAEYATSGVGAACGMGRKERRENEGRKEGERLFSPSLSSSCILASTVHVRLAVENGERAVGARDTAMPSSTEMERNGQQPPQAQPQAQLQPHHHSRGFEYTNVYDDVELDGTNTRRSISRSRGIGDLTHPAWRSSNAAVVLVVMVVLRVVLDLSLTWAGKRRGEMWRAV